MCFLYPYKYGYSHSNGWQSLLKGDHIYMDIEYISSCLHHESPTILGYLSDNMDCHRIHVLLGDRDKEVIPINQHIKGKMGFS
jgi:hypothetical protein